jgi:hypothetical protein
MFKKVLFTLCLLGSVSANACDVKEFDSSKEENKVIYEKLKKVMENPSASYGINTVDIDNDGVRDYIIFYTEKEHGYKGNAFIGVKENQGKGMTVILTGYVPVKDNMVQCDSNNKIIFYPKAK